MQFNGLPSLSNGYIVDGLETNDPLTNLNSGLSTNLVLGLNSIAEVTVNTLSYAVDQGRYGASQVNYVTKSGTNQFHGNLYELWNGSQLQRRRFLHQRDARKPQAALHGESFRRQPGRARSLHDKLFFFFDTEWVRIALPIVTATTVPTPAFQNYVLQQLPLRRTDSVTGSTYRAAAATGPVLSEDVLAVRQHGGTPLAVLGCPFNSDGSARAAIRPTERLREPAEHLAFERRPRAGADRRASITTSTQNNTAWFRFQADTGLQAAYTDPINPLFNAISPQPLYSFAAGYTHIFSPELVNYFNPAFSWYESLFGPADFQKTLAAFRSCLQGSGANAPFTTLGGLDNTWVQGGARRASSSTTIWRGPSARTNCGSAPTPGSSG